MSKSSRTRNIERPIWLKKNKEVDIHKLRSLYEELQNKDHEYDLLIKGLKDKIYTTKKENNILSREIEKLKSANYDMDKNTTRLNKENVYKQKELINTNIYNENKEKYNKSYLVNKYKEEFAKSQLIKKKILFTQSEISKYKAELEEIESILNYTNPEIYRESEEMKKFLEEL